MTFTNEQVTEAIKEVVAEKGEEHVYEAAWNTPHKRAAQLSYSYDDCIVGCVIRKLDPELHATVLEVERVETSSWPLSAIGGAYEAYTTIYETIYEAFTDEQIRALREAQAEQDSGNNWAIALHQYIKAIGESE